MKSLQDTLTKVVSYYNFLSRTPITEQRIIHTLFHIDYLKHTSTQSTYTGLNYTLTSNGPYNTHISNTLQDCIKNDQLRKYTIYLALNEDQLRNTDPQLTKQEINAFPFDREITYYRICNAQIENIPTTTDSWITQSIDKFAEMSDNKFSRCIYQLDEIKNAEKYTPIF